MEGTDAKIIGSRIWECRKKLGYSREKLAEVADVSNSFLAEVEHGTKNFSVPVLSRLCKALVVSADYLMFGRDDTADASDINRMLSGIDPRYLPHLEELLAAYIKTISLAESQQPIR